MKDFLPGYLAEVEDHLQSSRANLIAVEVAMEKDEPAPKPIRELFRSLHTIKGLSAMIGIEPIVEIAHAMETVLRAADRTGGLLPKGANEPLVRGLRAIDERIAELAADRPVKAAPAPLIDALNAVEPFVASAGTARAPQGGAQRSVRALRVDFVPSLERAGRGMTISSVRERLAKIAEIVKIVPRSNEGGVVFTILLTTDADDAAIAEAAGAEPSSVTAVAETEPPSNDDDDDKTRGGVVRVEVSRLDDALEKLSALEVTRFRLARALAALKESGADIRELSAILQANTRGLRDLRGSIMRARMVSVSEMLDRVPLLVRGLAMSTKKNVRAELDAGRAELDKGVADRLFPAIVHLIRNAVDHGIETPAERTRAGKPEQATVRVRSTERGTNRLELTIEDDGAGIDRQKVAEKAGRPVPANDAELLDLISIPGLSTRERASETSGRGLGVDIVRRIVRDELGGELELSSVAGRGTKLTLRVPLSISIIDAFSFFCGDTPFVVPVSMVEEIVELESPEDFFVRRGEVVTLLRLNDLFSMTGVLSDRSDRPNRADRPKAIVVRRQGELYAFAVDRMAGREEVVVRPLEDPLVRVAGVSGSTDLGDGKPTLVLDLIALSQSRKQVLS